MNPLHTMTGPDRDSMSGSDAARLKALEEYGVLDTPTEAAFDRLVQLAAKSCGTPIALISLIDSERQWFKAEIGLGVRETPRAWSFCDHVIRPATPELTVVPDAAADERFRDNPLVSQSPGIRFYAGAPLVTNDGVALGTICVIDTEPRDALSDSQSELLSTLADIVVDELELLKSKQHNELLQAELSHRIKNIFAVVKSLARRSIPEQKSAHLLANFEARIEALAAAHDYAATGDTDNSFRVLVRNILGIGRRADMQRFRLDVPDVALGRNTSQTVALLLHELLTNAAKYGALAVPTGRVELTAALHDGALVLSWIERGATGITAPREKGFGLRMIEGMAAMAGGSVDMDWRDEGLRCTAKIGSLES